MPLSDSMARVLEHGGQGPGLAAGSTGPDVALVSGDEAIAGGLQSLLASHGFNVAAYRGLSCLTAVMRHHEVPCAILHAGHGNGPIDLLTADIASLAGQTDIIIIDSGDRELGRLHGLRDAVMDIIELPFQQARLLERVGQVLRRRGN